jgi:hypothetical protein
LRNQDLVKIVTLAEAYDRIIDGASPAEALTEFINAFHRAESVEDIANALADEPNLTGNFQLNALAGAIAEYLARQHRLWPLPAWVTGPARFLEQPWHTCPYADLGLREYLTFASPGEFKTRNIFTDGAPLRPGSSHLFHHLKILRKPN